MDMTFKTVATDCGVPLSIVQNGNTQGPAVLFIHGFSQSYLSWEQQLESELAEQFALAAFDLRGHGSSGKPHTPESYTSSRTWACDVNAVINAAGFKTKPVLVGWSWAGFTIMHYVRHYGVENIAGINFVGANTALKGPMPTPSPDARKSMHWLRQMTSTDITENLTGVTTFIDIMTAKPLPPDIRSSQIISNMMTPAYVRAAMMRDRADNSDIAPALSVPVLVSHGTEDAIVPYGAGTSIMSVLPKAALSTYNGVGHAPFLEDPVRFNNELFEFVSQVN